MMGHSRTWIDDWKRGRGMPNDDDIYAMALLLHTTPAYLTGDTDDPRAFKEGIGRYSEFSRSKKNNPATAQDARQRELVVLTRMASQLPEEDYKRLVKNFEDTLDIYLRARGLDPDDYR